jgi:hypothetical protein
MNYGGYLGDVIHKNALFFYIQEDKCQPLGYEKRAFYDSFPITKRLSGKSPESQ